jgi:L-idonate 5-dehydrogenase
LTTNLEAKVLLRLLTRLRKRVELFGTFRFHEEFQWAVQALASGRVNVDPILSAQFPFPDAVKAFELATDRRQAVKVSKISEAVFQAANERLSVLPLARLRFQSL